MGKFIRSILDTNDWMNTIASFNTVFFSVLFLLIVIGVLRMKKKDVEKYKNFPLDDD